MGKFNPQNEIPPSVLATDLDGTLIPLPDNSENSRDLGVLREATADRRIKLVFATGRRHDSVLDAIEEYQLPIPEWIVCDVGSSINHREPNGFVEYAPYVEHLLEITAGSTRTDVEQAVVNVDGLRLQAREHQRPFKISYESQSGEVDAFCAEVQEILGWHGLPYGCLGCIDPSTGHTMLDVLPRGVSKASALIWLATHADFLPDEVVYAGDSGNDLAALVSGFRAIVVRNATPGIAEKVRAELSSRRLEDRMYHARTEATSGVLEGCRHFGLV